MTHCLTIATSHDALLRSKPVSLLFSLCGSVPVFDMHINIYKYTGMSCQICIYDMHINKYKYISQAFCTYISIRGRGRGKWGTRQTSHVQELHVLLTHTHTHTHTHAHARTNILTHTHTPVLLANLMSYTATPSARPMAVADCIVSVHITALYCLCTSHCRDASRVCV